MCSQIKITNNDILFSDLEDLPVCDAMYVDPPWGLGNLRYWRTMNNQRDFDSDWMVFLRRLRFQYDTHVKLGGPALIEMGFRFIKDVEVVFGKSDSRYDIVYNNGKNKNVLMVYNTSIQDVSGMAGLYLVVTVLNSIVPRPQKIFDPCAGLGTTLRACKVLKMDCYANELNTKRYERARHFEIG